MSDYLDKLNAVISRREVRERRNCLVALYFFEIPLETPDMEVLIVADLQRVFGENFPDRLRCIEARGVLAFYIPFYD